MTPEQRARASIDLTLTYLRSMYPDWRLTKVLTARKLLEDRYTFFDDFINEVKDFEDETGEATIAQQIKHGLYFDTISHCVQYVEDLFALILAAKKPDYFIRSMVNFDAGKVTNLIKGFNPNQRTIAEGFHFPVDLPFENDEDKKEYDQGVERLIQLINEMIIFHKDYQYFYNQYKHGLSIALRPFGTTYGADQIKEDKEGDFPPYLAAYDNRKLSVAHKKGTFKIENGAFLPGFTENVRPFIGKLEKENNFLRLVHPQDKQLDFNVLVEAAYKIRACIRIFIFNYSHKIDPRLTIGQFHLPLDYKTGTVIKCSFDHDDLKSPDS